MISFLKNNYKFILFVIVVAVTFYFIFFRPEDSTENDSEYSANVFVVPEQEKMEKTKEELYQERFAVTAEKEIDIGKIIEEQERNKQIDQSLPEAETDEPVAMTTNHAPVNKPAQSQNRVSSQRENLLETQRITETSVAYHPTETESPTNNPTPTYQASQNQGTTTYRNQQPADMRNSFKASIFGDQLITQSGLIKVRVTEKINLGNLSLERNDILEANVNVSGGVIGITIPGVIKNGLYYELNATGLSESGRQIVYNESDLRKASKEASGSIAASAAQEITGSNTIGNAVGSVLSRTVSTSSSNTIVTLQDGYKLIFFTK